MTERVLDGQRALVTGATSGIGRAVAERLADLGAEVVVHGRDAARGAQVVREITDRGGAARFLAADLTDAASTLDLARGAGELDILVSNAGWYAFAPTAATDADSFDRHVAINTRAPFLLVGALAPGMVDRGRGTIVTVGSSAARMPAPAGAAYGASKAAVELLTRYWATEFGPHGVRVNAVSPGPVVTEGTVPMFGSRGENVTGVNARGRAGDPGEIAEVVAFLAGPASSYVNGAVLFADGGERSLLPG